jgi:hypothetical protein
MLIRLNHQKLEKNKRGSAFQFLFPVHYPLGTFQYFVQLPTYPVLFIYILGGTVNRNNQPIQATFNGFPCCFIC